jgi:hypothetical protein
MSKPLWPTLQNLPKDTSQTLFLKGPAFDVNAPSDPVAAPPTNASSILNLILQIISIVQVVGKVVQPFLTGGIPQALKSEYVIQKTTDLLHKGVADGTLNPSVLENHQDIVKAVVAAHPDVQNK